VVSVYGTYVLPHVRTSLFVPPERGGKGASLNGGKVVEGSQCQDLPPQSTVQGVCFVESILMVRNHVADYLCSVCRGAGKPLEYSFPILVGCWTCSPLIGVFTSLTT